MEYANKIEMIPNVFRVEPLEISELKDFYYEGTMEVRTGDKYKSPIEDIIDACTTSGSRKSFLLLGHRGCGKSTELNRMTKKLEDAEYPVRIIPCSIDMDLLNPVYADLLILMGDALLDIANELDCQISPETEALLKSFWTREIEEVEEEHKEQQVEGQTGVSIGAGLLVKAFGKVKTQLSYSGKSRETYRNTVIQRASDWLIAIKSISDGIAEKADKKQPILIFEDLDKLNPADAWKVFYAYSKTLTSVDFPVIYTFPISLSFEPGFSALEAYFEIMSLPMIRVKQNNQNNEPDAGYETVRKIVEKRADLNLFEEDALKLMIEKTGGSLRDLFTAINDCAIRARRRKSSCIEMEDAVIALEKLKNSLTRRINEDHYRFLAEIHTEKHEIIGNQEMLLKMLQANAVLEYNDNWRDVHPLVADFLVEQGFVTPSSHPAGDPLVADFLVEQGLT